jgi:nitroreductase
MNQSNYEAWNINTNDFPSGGAMEEKIFFILRYGILAPSGHNSQPWNFKITDNSILLTSNKNRSLSKSDPDKKILTLSFGCLLENVIITARYFGYSTSVEFQGDTILLKFTLSPRTDNLDGELINQISARATERGEYLPTALSKSFLNILRSRDNENIKLFIVSDEEKIKKEKLISIMLESQIEAMDNSYFRDELSHFIISNYSKSGTGMPGFCLGIPGPVSIIAPALIKKINLSRATKKQDKKILSDHTPAIAILTTKANKEDLWLEAGQIFQNLWLQATKENIRFSPLAAAAQIPKYSNKVKELLNTDYEPAILFRLGYTEKKILHSPRLPVNDLLN